MTKILVVDLYGDDKNLEFFEDKPGINKALKDFNAAYEAETVESKDEADLTPKQKRLLDELGHAGDRRFAGFMENRGFKQPKVRLINLEGYGDRSF